MHEVTYHEYVAYSQGWCDAIGNPIKSAETYKQQNAAFLEWCSLNDCTLSKEVRDELNV